jgi:hypothetical protein
VLLPPVVLPFDAEEFAGCTVADVLGDPQRFDRATLADPVEGTEYGVCKAMILRRADGEPWVNSFAHGRSVFELRYDATTIEAAIMAGTERAAADIVVRMLAHAEVNKTDEDHLIGLSAERAKVGKRPISQRLKDLRSTAKASRANEAQAAAAATSLPEIVVVQGLRHEAADAGIAAMHRANVPFYQRTGGLVRVCSTPARTSDGKEIAVPGVIPLPLPMLGRALNTSAVWRKSAAKGKRQRALTARMMLSKRWRPWPGIGRSRRSSASSGHRQCARTAACFAFRDMTHRQASTCTSLRQCRRSPNDRRGRTRRRHYRS